MIVDFPNFEKGLLIIENILLGKNLQQSDNYKEWYEYFVNIYGKKLVNLRLYSVHALLCLIANLFILRYILNQELKFDLKQFSSSNLSSLNNSVEENYGFQF